MVRLLSLDDSRPLKVGVVSKNAESQIVVSEATPLQSLRAHRFEASVALWCIVLSLIHFVNPAAIAETVVGFRASPWDVIWQTFYFVGGWFALAGLAFNHRWVIRRWRIQGVAVELAGLILLCTAMLVNGLLYLHDSADFHGGLITLLCTLIASIDRGMSIVIHRKWMVPVAVSSTPKPRRDRRN
jgi:hypothetical protein